MFCTFETRGKLRTAAEEHNLAANSVEEDKMNAEFICLFVKESLSGYDLLNRLEHEEGRENANEYIYQRSKKVPQPEGGQEFRWYNFADVYGFRPPLEVLFYLSPWEFLAYWIVIPLQPPWKEDYLYTRWISPMTSEKAIEMEAQGDELLPGTHYEVNASPTIPHRLVSDCPDHDLHCVYPTDPSVPELSCFRSQWILRRRQRPVVPVLRGPMPHRGIKDKEKRSRLLSTYVLGSCCALTQRITYHISRISISAFYVPAKRSIIPPQSSASE